MQNAFTYHISSNFSPAALRGGELTSSAPPKPSACGGKNMTSLESGEGIIVSSGLVRLIPRDRDDRDDTKITINTTHQVSVLTFNSNTINAQLLPLEKTADIPFSQLRANTIVIPLREVSNYY